MCEVVFTVIFKRVTIYLNPYRKQLITSAWFLGIHTETKHEIEQQNIKWNFVYDKLSTNEKNLLCAFTLARYRD